MQTNKTHRRNSIKALAELGRKNLHDVTSTRSVAKPTFNILYSYNINKDRFLGKYEFWRKGRVINDVNPVGRLRILR